MPLRDGCSRDVIRDNIAKLMREGRPRDQAVAAALDHARRQGCDEAERRS